MFNLPAKKKVLETMKWIEELLDAKHSKMKGKQKKRKGSMSSHKTYMSCVEHLATRCVHLMYYWNSRSSWVNLLQESPAGTIKYKRLILFALTLTFSIISDTLETCRWMLNLKETFPFLTRAGERNLGTSNDTRHSCIWTPDVYFSMNWISLEVLLTVLTRQFINYMSVH